MLAVALELLGSRGKFGQSEFFHIRRGPPVIGRALRHHYDGPKTRTIFADGFANSNLGLNPSIGAALTRPVQKQNDGQLLSRGPTLRNKNLVFVGGAVESKR